MKVSWLRTALVVALLVLIVLLGVPIAMGSMPGPMAESVSCPDCDATAAGAPLLSCAAMLAALFILVSAATGRRLPGSVLRPLPTFSSAFEHPPRLA